MNTPLFLLLTLTATPNVDVQGQPETTSWYQVIDLSVSLGFGQTTDQTRLAIDGREISEGQTNLVSFLEVGAAYPVNLLQPPVGHLEGRTRLQLGLQLADARWPIALGQDGLWVFDLSDNFGLIAGLSAGIRIDLTESRYSAFALGLPLGLRWGSFELMYRPNLDIALASTSQAVLGGERTDGAQTGLRPFWVTLGWVIDL